VQQSAIVLEYVYLWAPEVPPRNESGTSDKSTVGLGVACAVGSGEDGSGVVTGAGVVGSRVVAVGVKGSVGMVVSIDGCNDDVSIAGGGVAGAGEVVSDGTGTFVRGPPPQMGHLNPPSSQQTRSSWLALGHVKSLRAGKFAGHAGVVAAPGV
jgi:hypothetical protein